MSIKQAPIQHDNTANLPSEPEGYRNFPTVLIKAHEAQPIERQGKQTQQAWRTLAYIAVERAKKMSMRLSKADMMRFHALVQSAGSAHDHAYKGQENSSRGPAQVLIQLFGASGAGERIAKNLTAMIPTVKVVDAVDAEVVEDEHTV